MFYNQELTPILQFSTNFATPPTPDGTTFFQNVYIDYGHGRNTNLP
jgi:hypothetical protein